MPELPAPLHPFRLTHSPQLPRRHIRLDGPFRAVTRLNQPRLHNSWMQHQHHNSLLFHIHSHAFRNAVESGL